MKEIAEALITIEKAILEDNNVNAGKIYKVLTEIVNVIKTTNVSLMSIADSLNRINSKYVI
jgi:hypothetical protein